MFQYTWFQFINFLVDSANDIIGKNIVTEYDIMIAPENVDADLFIPLFKIGKTLQITPDEILSKFKKVIKKNNYFQKVELLKSGFLNFYVNWPNAMEMIFSEFKTKKDDYGKFDIGKGKTIIVDYSSPNIAKPFNIGHLRSTVIGHSILNIQKFLGYNVIGDNHLGDWGTQFGKLIAAYKKWGSKEKVEKRLITELVELYVKFHRYIKENPDEKKIMEDCARDWFKQLEAGEKNARELWEWFVNISLKEFTKTYELLNIDFDYYFGESFYNDMLKDVIQETLDKGVAQWEEIETSAHSENGNENGQTPLKEWIIMIKLDKFGIDVPLLIQKKDGTSLYATRDLATAKFRIKQFSPDKMLYVVGNEQQLYFKQIFKAFELLGYRPQCEHIGFGLVSLPDGRMSTRKGRFIYLDDVLKEAVKRAADIIRGRNFTTDEIERISKIVGIGAVKYADLSQNRKKNIIFDWDKMLNLKGNSGPYIQYVAVRIKSILNQLAADGTSIYPDFDAESISKGLSRNLVNKLYQFPRIVRDAGKFNEPHRIANYLFELSQIFNLFYKHVPVLKAKPEKLRNTRVLLIKMVETVIKNGLFLIGIDIPEKM